MSRLGISSIALNDTDWPILARHHVSRIELAPTMIAPWESLNAEQIREYASAHNVTIFSLQSIFYKTDIVIAEMVDEAIQHLTKVLQWCVDLGIPKVTFGSPHARRVNKPGDADVIQTFIQTLANQFPSVIICVEPNARAYGCNFLTTLESTLKFVAEINCPNVKVQLDVGNFILEEDSLAPLTNQLFRLGAVHISDQVLGPLITEETHREIAAFLTRIQYTGPISIEARPGHNVEDLFRVTESLYAGVLTQSGPTCLVGYTGFVGSNLRDQRYFDEYVNRVNLESIRGRHFSRVCFTAMPGSMWYANSHPEEDRAALEMYQTILKTITANHFVLISTINVYGLEPGAFDERDDPVPTTSYGKHRLQLEAFIQQTFPRHQIVRLPGLFGPHLKKNIVYDLANNHRMEHVNLASQYQWYDISRLADDLDARAAHSVCNYVTPLMETAQVVHLTCWDPGRCANNSISTSSTHIQSVHGYVQTEEEVRTALSAYFARMQVDLRPRTVYMINTSTYPTPWTHGLFIRKFLKGFAQSGCEVHELKSDDELDIIPDTQNSVLIFSNHFALGATDIVRKAHFEYIRSTFQSAIVLGWCWAQYQETRPPNWVFVDYFPQVDRTRWPTHCDIMGGTEFAPWELRDIPKTDASYNSCFVGSGYKRDWTTNLEKCYYYASSNPFLIGPAKHRVYESSRVMLGFHNPPNIPHGRISDRVYEGMRACCVVLTDNPRAEKMTDGIVEYVKSKQALEARIQYYVDHPEEASVKARLGLEYLRKHGTWYASARAFLELFHLYFNKE